MAHPEWRFVISFPQKLSFLEHPLFMLSLIINNVDFEISGVILAPNVKGLDAASTV